ncbi:MAG: tetratricopeptide repeat protein [Candidatus Moduliflexus flocculans]|nr:tetratricopeptide repeat protein [Candidatus Moduliflexus flocculans]
MKRERLVEVINVCRQGLTNSGLAEYRKGNLEKAIEIWDSLLAFDPGNAEIKKAVETAKAQLEKLRESGSDLSIKHIFNKLADLRSFPYSLEPLGYYDFWGKKLKTVPWRGCRFLGQKTSNILTSSAWKLPGNFTNY